MAEVEAELTAPGQHFEMETLESGGHSLRVWKRAAPSAAERPESLRERGASPYLVYADACARIATLARPLREPFGVAKGDRVALALRSHPEWPLIFFAALAVPACGNRADLPRRRVPLGRHREHRRGRLRADRGPRQGRRDPRR
jgi:non-ribosomal peptide synthetase component E (peptide arylation enzyme)